MVGRTIGQYRFVEKLGAGGMGEVFKAQHTTLNRFVAIKVLTGASSGDPERRRRFVQEAQAASALNHPNIITIHDIVTEGDSQFLVMEYVQGKTLVDLIPRGGLRVPQVLKFSVQMADALLTTFGIDRFGVAAEANPILALGFILFGPAASLTIAKGGAVVGAVTLYRLSRHMLLALLTVMYVFVAIMPWAWALAVA